MHAYRLIFNCKSLGRFAAQPVFARVVFNLGIIIVGIFKIIKAVIVVFQKLSINTKIYQILLKDCMKKRLKIIIDFKQTK